LLDLVIDELASKQPSTKDELIFEGTWKEDVVRRMVDTFNEAELQDFLCECFPDIRYENLIGETLKQKFREVVGYAERHGLCDDLIKALKEARGHIPWPVQ